MKAKTHLRRASADDFRIFYSREPPEGLVGFVAEREDEIVAFAYVWIDQIGRAWAGIDKAHTVPPIMLHRAIAWFFAAMQQEGIPALHALCDERLPAATRWLIRLGFVIDESVAPVYMPVVDKFLPVWKRALSDVESRS